MGTKCNNPIADRRTMQHRKLSGIVTSKTVNTRELFWNSQNFTHMLTNRVDSLQRKYIIVIPAASSLTRKLRYRKDDRAMRLICMGALKIFGSPWLRPRPRILSPHFNGLLFRSILSMWVQNLKFIYSFTRSWDNRVYPKKFYSPTLRFLQNF